jgi:hypothetical protein
VIRRRDRFAEGGRPHDKQRAIGAAAVIDHVAAREGDTH